MMMTKKTFLSPAFFSLGFTLLLILSALPSQGQITITGTVTDSAGGGPLIGASVMAKGTVNGTVTDFDGKYQLRVPEGTEILVFSYTGFSTEEVAIEGRQQIDVVMKPEEIRLEEVVVTAYGAQEKASGRRQAKMQYRAMAASPAMGRSGYPAQSYSVARDHNTEDYALIKENRFFRPQNSPLSTFSIDVDAASYSNIRRFLNEGGMPPKDAVRIEEMVNYFDYDYPEPKGYEPFTVNTEIGPCPWQPKHRLLHIGLQGKRIPTAQLPASNLVFLLDVSGSMSAPNKLPLVIESLKMLTDNLRPDDKVAIVVYAGAAGVVLPATPGSDKQKIKEALQKLEAGGSTAGGEGIKLAYKIAGENLVEGGNNRVILATDGDFNVGASSDAEMVRLIEKERESGVFLTVLGFGMGNYKDNKMQQLADKGNGNHAYIDNLNEARKVLISEFGGTLFTIAKDVKLQLEFNPAKVAGYRLIGYENRLLDDEDFSDDTKDAGELGAGHTVTALYEIIPAGVESEFLTDKGELKYQQVQPKKEGNGDLCTIKLRYKQPEAKESRLIEKSVVDQSNSGGSPTDNFFWSAATAEFGMLLRESEFKGNATFDHCRKLAEKATGKDPNGYRAEMITLIQKSERLKSELVAEGKN